MLLKKGTPFPHASLTKSTYPEVIAAALRKDVGNSHRAVKVVMGWTNASERTVKNWLSGKIGPSGEHLIALLHHSDAALDAFLKLAKRERSTIAVGLLDARKQVAEILDILDRLLVDNEKQPAKPGETPPAPSAQHAGGPRPLLPRERYSEDGV